MKSTDPAIVEYLESVDQALFDLPSRARHDIVDQLREHIDAALSDGRSVDVRAVLADLGNPDRIAESARQELGGGPLTPPRGRVREWAAVVLLPLIWPIGVVLVAMSSIWTRREKILAIVAFPGGIYLPLLMSSLVLGAQVCAAHTAADGSQILDSCRQDGLEMTIRAVLEGVLLIVPVIVALYLAIRLMQRSRSEMNEFRTH